MAPDKVKGMRILVTEELHPDGLQMLKDAGMVLVHWDWQKLTDPKLPTDFDAIIGKQYYKCNKELIDRLLPRLKYVITCGAGLDNIDLKYCAQKGIKVFNAPGSNAASVAEHVIMVMLAVLRNLNACQDSVHAGKFERFELAGNELMGKTIGIIGVGAIGRHLVHRLSVFGVDIVYNDIRRDLETEQRYGVRFVDLDTLYKEADLITLHAWLDDKTMHMINDSAIAKMKKGAILVNAARGKLVDQEALVRGLESGKLRGAAIDVYEDEPPNFKPLLERRDVVFTPHNSGVPKEGYVRMNTWAVDNFLRGA
jgi:phosphoglycerate dehydrogenase-like enzyme